MPALRQEIESWVRDYRKHLGDSSERTRRIVWAMNRLPAILEENARHISEAEYSHVLDVLLLTFHHAYFAWLPKLTKERSLRSALLNAFEEFAALVPNLADRYHVTGLVNATRGEMGRAIEDFRACLAATHADDHDFMSSLQLLWMFLLEQRRYRDAMTLLSDVYPRVARADLDEMKTLLLETFQAATESRRSRHGKRPVLA